MREKISAYRTELTVFLIFSAVFVLAASLAAYVLPFLISLTAAVVMKPVYDFFRHRFSFRSGFAAAVISLAVFCLPAGAAGFLLYLTAAQAASLFDRYGYIIEGWFKAPGIFEKLRDGLIGGNLTAIVSDLAAGVIRAVPLTLSFVIVTFALTVFFLSRLSMIRDVIVSRAGEGSREKVKKVISTAYRLVRRFIRSYFILYMITFGEAVFIFYLTGVSYPLAFAFITAIADILPVLGPGAVYLPFAASFILNGNYIGGITLAGYFLLTVILRQILEPKIVSDTVKVHPIVMLSAIYFSVAAMDIRVLFYIISLILLFKVLRASDVISEKA